MNNILLIAILIITVIMAIMGVNFFSGNNNSQNVILDCNTLCQQMGSRGWTFPGVRPIGTFFVTKEDCISACQNRFKK